jgi:hypothetical protein
MGNSSGTKARHDNHVGNDAGESVHVEVTLEDALLQRVVVDHVDACAALEVDGVGGGFDVFWERHR